jgi:hypothetical protein
MARDKKGCAANHGAALHCASASPSVIAPRGRRSVPWQAHWLRFGALIVTVAIFGFVWSAAQAQQVTSAVGPNGAAERLLPGRAASDADADLRVHQRLGANARDIRLESGERPTEASLARAAVPVAALDGVGGGAIASEYIVAALFAFVFLQSLLSSMIYYCFHGSAPHAVRPVQVDGSTGSDIDYAAEAREKLQTAIRLWRDAEAAIAELDAGQPLRTLLMNDLSRIGRQLNIHPELSTLAKGAVTVYYSVPYWRMLHREISRANRELLRICAVARAGVASFGGPSALPQMPKTVSEAYFALGVNSEVSEDTLKRLIRALRQCWHPDLAQNDSDREYREARIRQINVASDLIASRSYG